MRSQATKNAGRPPFLCQEDERQVASESSCRRWMEVEEARISRLRSRSLVWIDDKVGGGEGEGESEGEDQIKKKVECRQRNY